MEDNPWLHIPAEDYEAHMRAVGQAAALGELFARVYAERRPPRVAILGCTTGNDLGHVDPAITKLAVGVDINPAYIEVARARSSARGSIGARVHLICGDVLSVELPRVELDLVHAALLLEYVDPGALFARVRRWLSRDGVCSVITQEPSANAPAVSPSAIDSLRALAAHMSLRPADEIAALAARAGLRRIDARAVDLPTGKRLVHALFVRARDR